jgi:hypothetical protein
MQANHPGSSIHLAERLQGRLPIVRGSGGENVHSQGTERLANRLAESGKWVLPAQENPAALAY